MRFPLLDGSGRSGRTSRAGLTDPDPGRRWSAGAAATHRTTRVFHDGFIRPRTVGCPAPLSSRRDVVQRAAPAGVADGLACFRHTRREAWA
ncbi:hypothetical protein Pma05_02370 [Plantactinospora mayteni]|uniref:Uncharacterized protein n=1 Tax=Plantactinospora mayteni TaxID=566021 RepID=A0ABQ4EG81_9ACTN|nr:hypothetical protein Pma05_02370 [Plantactinospora mayteni]